MSVETALPLTRIRTIMKSSLDTGQIANEVLFMVAKSTEMFVQSLTKEAYTQTKGNMLKYENLAKHIQEKESLEFLLQIIPQKIKVKDFRQILENEESGDSESDSDNDRK